MIVAGASAYALRADWQRFRDIADEVGALLMVDMAHYAGLVAAGLYPSPVGIADFVTSTTHKTLRGPRGGIILAGRRAREGAQLRDLPRRIQGGPLMHVIAAKAVAFKEALEPAFKAYQAQVLANAQEDGRRRSPSAACASSPAAPRATSSSSTCARRRSPARTRRPRSARRTSR